MSFSSILRYDPVHCNFPSMSFPEVIEVRAEVQRDGDEWRATGAGFDRTARRVIRVRSSSNIERVRERHTNTPGNPFFSLMFLFYFTRGVSWNSREMPVEGVEWIVACRPDQCPGIWCAAMYLFHAQKERHDMPWAILQCTKMGDLVATKMGQWFHVISVHWLIALSLSCIVPVWWAVPCIELFKPASWWSG